MADYRTGKDGKVRVDDATDYNVKGWSFDPVSDEIDITHTGTTGIRLFTPGLKTATGNFNGTWDADADPTPALEDGNTVELFLYIGDPTDGLYWHIPAALLLGLPTASDVGTDVTWASNFRANFDVASGYAYDLVGD